MIVYGDVEVGVDVEKTNENYNLIYDSCFTNVEMQWIDKADKASKAQRMAMVWTMKEAYLKYIGTGLFKSMHSFSMDMENGAILDDTGEIVRNVYTHCFSISKNYVCSVCSSEVQVCESEVSEMEMQSFLKKGNMVFGTP
ncbi:MAG: 4'-phosphopantetheinyl transferase superfamily protein [Herbinix sp.]|nr:4'-phosphopantetheinyl transferase superfamily protein [Herbinix sp.]